MLYQTLKRTDFFGYTEKHSVCQNEIGPVLGPSNALTTDKYEMCCSLLKTV